MARKLIDAYNSMGYRRPNFELINYEEHFPIKKDYIIDDAGGAYLLTKGVSDSEASNFIDSISLRGSKVRWRNAEKSKYNP